MIDKQYVDLLLDINENGEEVQSRNSITKRKLGLTFKFESTPLISVRNTAWKNALREMEWFLSGNTNIDNLHPKVQHWWKPWANQHGYITNSYGVQFTNFSYSDSRENIQWFNQIKHSIDLLKNQPKSRRNVLTTWNPGEMADSITPITNCHGSLITLHVDNDNKIHMFMNQRSADMILGVPHNFIQYWAFLMYLAHKSGRKVGSFTWMGHDCHVYQDHLHIIDKLNENVNKVDSTPNLIYNPTSDEFKADDFSLDSEYVSIVKDKLNMVV